MSDTHNEALERASTRTTLKSAATLFISAIIIVALYVGREAFVPIALAILFSFILAPLVKMLRRLGAGRVVSVLAVVLGAAAGAAILVVVVTMQISQLAADLPRYQTTIVAKMAALKQMRVFGYTIDKATDALNKVSSQINDPAAATSGDPPKGEAKAPIAVEVHQLPMSPIETMKIVLGPVLTTLASVGIVLLFLISILLQREDVRGRVIRLSGVRDLTRATAAMNDAAGRLSRLLLMQSIINASFGVFIGAGLWFIGVPNPVLWGVFTAFMRFVPFIGTWIAAAMPFVLAAAVDPGWAMLFEAAGLFLAADLVVGQFVEPMLHGQSTGLSPLAIIVAAIFWTLLWGPVGLVLSTPLTVCLATLGRHVEHLAFFDVLFGEEPALSPAQVFYQRMLAEDALEATDQSVEYLKTHSLEEYCGDVVIAGLGLAVLDLRAGLLEKPRLPPLAESALEVIDNVFDDDAAPPESVDAENAGYNPEIVCFSGSNRLDEAASRILARLLRQHGLNASVASFDALTHRSAATAGSVSPPILCISQLSPGSSVANTRYLLRRLRRSLPSSEFVLCFWNCEGAGTPDAPIQEGGEHRVAVSLQQAIAICQDQAGRLRSSKAAA